LIARFEPEWVRQMARLRWIVIANTAVANWCGTSYIAVKYYALLMAPDLGVWSLSWKCRLSLEVERMRQAQLVDQKAQLSFEGLDALEALFQGRRREPLDDLSLCFVCMQWACTNPNCRLGRRCDLQTKLDQLEASA